MDSRAWCVCLLIVLAAGCGGERVGGPCEYETVLGTAELIRQPDGILEARFSPAGPVAPAEWMQPVSDMRFPVSADAGDITTGAPYPAELSRITKGTCTPFWLTLLSSDTACRGIFLPMDEDGRLTGEGMEARVAEIFKRLLPAWPELVVTLGGQTAEGASKAGPRDRALVRDVEGVAGRLAEAGVLPDRIRIRPLIASTGLGTEGEGVWISFCLTGQAADF